MFVLQKQLLHPVHTSTAELGQLTIALSLICSPGMYPSVSPVTFRPITPLLKQHQYEMGSSAVTSIGAGAALYGCRTSILMVFLKSGFSMPVWSQSALILYSIDALGKKASEQVQEHNLR